MKIDKMLAINLAMNLIARGRRKNLEMRFQYLHEQVANGKLNLRLCRAGNQIVEIMTKGVQVKVFKKLRCMMNVDSLDTLI